MPIKWPADMDLIILLKIIENNGAIVDGKAISEAWPANHCNSQGAPPSPRAILERLNKTIESYRVDRCTSLSVQPAGKTTKLLSRDAPVAPSTPSLAIQRKPSLKTEAFSLKSQSIISTSPKHSDAGLEGELQSDSRPIHVSNKVPVEPAGPLSMNTTVMPNHKRRREQYEEHWNGDDSKIFENTIPTKKARDTSFVGSGCFDLDAYWTFYSADDGGGVLN